MLRPAIAIALSIVVAACRADAPAPARLPASRPADFAVEIRHGNGAGVGWGVRWFRVSAAGGEAEEDGHPATRRTFAVSARELDALYVAYVSADLHRHVAPPCASEEDTLSIVAHVAGSDIASVSDARCGNDAAYRRMDELVLAVEAWSVNPPASR